MSKIGYPWIVGVYASIAVGIILFVFWRNAFSSSGTSNLIVMFASIVIGAPVGVIISSKITGKVCDSEFSNHKVIKGIIWAFLGSFVGLGIGILFASASTLEGAGFLVIPGIMGGAIGGYSREIKTGIIGGAIGGFFASTLAGMEPVGILESYYGTGFISHAWQAGTLGNLIFGIIYTHLSNGILFGIVGAIAGASLGMISGAIGRIVATRLNKNPHRQ